MCEVEVYAHGKGGNQTIMVSRPRFLCEVVCRKGLSLLVHSRACLSMWTIHYPVSQPSSFKEFACPMPCNYTSSRSITFVFRRKLSAPSIENATHSPHKAQVLMMSLLHPPLDYKTIQAGIQNPNLGMENL